jgi:flagellar biosynthetic protein FliR
MISFTEDQILGWIAPLLWPFLRALALFSALPVLGTRTVPTRVRIGLAGFVAVAAQAGLPAMPVVALDSPLAFVLVLQQAAIGMAMGFAVRVVFAAVEFAGEIIGLQMGLNFASFFDPMTASTGNASGRFFGTLVAWLFVVGGGHLLVIAAVMQSFQTFPVAPEPLAFFKEAQPQRWGTEIFSMGIWIALPMVAMLLMVNLVLGLVSRVASQLNVFSVGFPVTLSVGLLGMLLSLPALQQPFTVALERMLSFFR